jgi:hypothetical protein
MYGVPPWQKPGTVDLASLPGIPDTRGGWSAEPGTPEGRDAERQRRKDYLDQMRANGASEWQVFWEAMYMAGQDAFLPQDGWVWDVIDAVGGAKRGPKPSARRPTRRGLGSPPPRPRTTPGKAPPVKSLTGRTHGGPAHDAAIDKYIAGLPAGASGARKNQAQVNARGQKVSDYRPDAQWTDANGVRHYYEVSSKTSTADPARLRAGDPNAIIEILDLETGITTVYKPGTPIP